MIHHQVIVVGGGPAGSACARALVAAGLDVVVMDAARFPRDKVCAGWLTPQVVAELELDVDEYRQGRTFQPFTGFRVGLVGGRREVEVDYGRPVSFGIRRVEFDDYLLRRSGAPLSLGVPLTSLRREDGRWIVNDAMTAPMLVGAGGHRCPVARRLNGTCDAIGRGTLVVAQEAELAIEPRDASAFTTRPDVPALYFCRDLRGYGWCIRKQDSVNVGLGRLVGHALPAAIAAFERFLAARGEVPPRAPWRWRGHAYLVRGGARRRVVDAGVLLAGDAAGLACPQSGEGIRPAVESGLLAAAMIVAARGEYSADRLAPYESRLRARFADGSVGRPRAGGVPAALAAVLGRGLLRQPSFVRRVVLDRWFLRAGEPILSAA